MYVTDADAAVAELEAAAAADLRQGIIVASLLGLGLFVVIALDPATVLFTGFLIYALSGPIRALFRGKPRKTLGATD